MKGEGGRVSSLDGSALSEDGMRGWTAIRAEG